MAAQQQFDYLGVYDNTEYNSMITDLFNETDSQAVPNVLKSYTFSDTRDRHRAPRNAVFDDEVNEPVVIVPSLGDFLEVRAHADWKARTIIRKDKRFAPMSMTVSVKCLMYKDGAIPPYFDESFETPVNMGFIVNETSIKARTSRAVRDLLAQVEVYVNQGSNIVFVRILSFKISFHRTRKNKGSSYKPLPMWIQNKKACVNVQNVIYEKKGDVWYSIDDNKCFLWSVIASIHRPADHVDRLSNYIRFAPAFKTEGIVFPVRADDKQYKKFEEQNLAVSIYVFMAPEPELSPEGVLVYTEEIYPIYRSKYPGRKHTVDLLLHDGHYTTIRNLSRLMGMQANKMKATKYFCRNCIQHFMKVELRDAHVVDCFKNGPQMVSLPKADDKVVKFKNLEKMKRHQFVIYADFESYIVPTDAMVPDSPSASYQIDTQRHVANSFFMHMVYDGKDIVVKPIMYNVTDGTRDIIDVFYESLYIMYNQIKVKIDGVEPIAMSAADRADFNAAKSCCICKKLCKKGLVRDHDHITGKYRGAACWGCNIKMQQSKEIPVIFHNLRGYDSHLILKGLAAKSLSAIPQTGEKFLSFTIDKKFKFIDSFRFLASGLDSLTRNLDAKSKDKLTLFSNVATGMNVTNETKLKLLTRKGVYPYEYVSGPEVFGATELPPIDSFYSSLSGGGISEADYAHAQSVWAAFDCKTFRDYHDLYLKLDVFLLADIFENFRKFSLDVYNLEPIYYYSLPGLSWDAMLLHNKQQAALPNSKQVESLELLTDYDMYMMFERGIRGGICQITKRYAKANLDTPVGEDKEYIRYFDANNLYGWAMMQYVPIGGFEWANDTTAKTILNTSDTADHGYLVECDLEYPVELHNLHSDYPLAPECMNVTPDMFSPWLKEKIADNDLHPLKKNFKLVLNVSDKTKYVLNYQILKLYVSLGLKLTKIHRVIKFRQANFLGGFIQYNTNMRAKATSDFEKDLFKLMNNSLFGKTMESVRSHKDCKFVIAHDDKTQKNAVGVFSSPFCSGYKVINDTIDVDGVQHSTICYHMDKKKLVLNKPIYIGQAVLDISKKLMYDFHFNTIKKEYPGDRSQLLFTDTDSLVYLIKTKDMNADMLKSNDYDMSEYAAGHPLASNKNKKVPGKFKDESPHAEIVEFVGLRAKMYSVLLEDMKEKKRLKGIKKSVIDKEINHSDYLRMLHSETASQYNTMTIIRSKEHTLFTTQLKKISLSNADDKRYLLNAIESLPYGHYRIVESKNAEIRKWMDADIMGLIDSL